MKRQRLWKGEMLMIKAKDYLKQVEKLDKMIKNKIQEFNPLATNKRWLMQCAGMLRWKQKLIPQ